MRYILAFVQPFAAPKVADALHQVSGVTGATFSNARGFGRGRQADAAGGEADPEALLGTAPKVRVEVMVRDGLEAEVVDAIRRAAYTGHRGDGKIFVLPLTRAVRISTGEEVGVGASEEGQSVL